MYLKKKWNEYSFLNDWICYHVWQHFSINNLIIDFEVLSEYLYFFFCLVVILVVMWKCCGIFSVYSQHVSCFPLIYLVVFIKNSSGDFVVWQPATYNQLNLVCIFPPFFFLFVDFSSSNIYIYWDFSCYFYFGCSMVFSFLLENGNLSISWIHKFDDGYFAWVYS